MFDFLRRKYAEVKGSIESRYLLSKRRFARRFAVASLYVDNATTRVTDFVSRVRSEVSYQFRNLKYKFYQKRRSDRYRALKQFVLYEFVPYVAGYGLALSIVANAFFGVAFTPLHVAGLGVAYYFLDNELPDIVTRLVRGRGVQDSSMRQG